MKKILSLISICIISVITNVNAQMAITTERNDAEVSQFGGSVAVGNAYEVLAINVDAIIKNQVAEVSVTQTIHNPGNRTLEVEIFFPLPNQGIVQNFMMMVNGKEVPGQLLKQEEARTIYEGIVRRKQDPALMEYVGYGLFKTSVFPIAPGEERTITVRYTQMCERYMNTISFSYPFGTQKFSAKALRSVSLNARIESGSSIKNIYSPSDDILVKREGEKSASIKMEKHYVLPTSDFKMVFTTDNNEVGATLLSYRADENKDGYFMLLASPSIEQEVKQSAKTVVFVLDRSGSMAGQKMEQSKNALSFVLKNLNEGDLFNIIVYDDRVESFKSELQRYNKEAMEEALTFVNRLSPGGGTNINGALTAAMDVLRDDKQPSYMIFLTDGLPTAGTTNEMEIAKNCTSHNTVKARLFAFGVGDDVNARLLDRLTTANNGLSEYVKPNEDIEASVAKLYSNISSPVLTDISIKFEGMNVQSTYPEILPDMFRGGQIMWVGKYTKPGKTKVIIKGKNNGVEKTFTFDVEFTSSKVPQHHDYIEKIWASRRIGHLINLIDLNGKNPELVDELVKLSKEYGILTPYTAFLAREDVNIQDMSSIQEQTDSELEKLDEISGSDANEQREYKSKLQNNTNLGENVAVVNDSISNNGTMKVVGNKTFYMRNGQWVEGTVTEDEGKNAIQITAYSDEYFKIARGQSAEFNQYLSVGSNVVVRLDGNVYQINSK